MQTVLITGGTGLIGHALRSELLEKGYRVIILTRNKSKHQPDSTNLLYAEWDVEKMHIETEAIEQADYIIHLAGAGVADKRWTAKRKQEIVSSRVKSGELLVKALNETPNNVKAVISISGIGYYGPNKDGKAFVESDNPSNDFLADTCVKWEAAIQPVERAERRLVIFRTGVVLSNKGGAFIEFKKPLQFGFATILGPGKQVISWIHVDDAVKLFLFAIENNLLSGVYNAVAPNPVSNKDLILKLAKSHNRFYIPITVPAFVLKIVVGELSVEVLKSATVSSSKIESTGFVFQYPTIESAIQKLVAS